MKLDRGALSGYRALDLTDEKGMFCARLLADMGAEVIRIEKPGGDANRSPFYHAANLGKLGITLDIETEKGQELFPRLVEKADFLIESQPPGYLDGLKLGYKDLSKWNPALIMASITAFGQSGLYRDYRSSDLIISALGGSLYINGEADLPPIKPYGNQSYYIASLYAAIGILLALQARHSTGKGQHIDISAQECAASSLDQVLVRYFAQNLVAKRQGSLYWNNNFRIFPCRDGYIMLTLFFQWETLIEWLASEGMAEDLADSRWLDPQERTKNISHVIEVLEKWTRSHTAAELVEKGQLMRFPWGEVAPVSKMVESPQLKERDFFIELEESGRKLKFPGAACRMSASPWQAGRHLSTAGEHNREVYGKLLGLTEKEIESLVKQGVI